MLTLMDQRSGYIIVYEQTIETVPIKQEVMH